MRTCIIFNPTAKGDKARRFRSELQQMARDCVLKPTTAPGAATPLALEAVRAGFETIVAAGGDGTVSEVVQGIASAADGLARVRLGLVPLGTINVFARELGLPKALASAWAVLRAGRETRVDLPWAEFASEGKLLRRHFVQLGGAGLDARAVAGVDWEWKKKVGSLAYMAAGLRALRGPQPIVQVDAAGERAKGELVLIGNGRFYGGSVPMFPQGDLRDGLLEVRVFPKINWATLARFGWAWSFGGAFVEPGGQFLRAGQVRLSSDVPVPFELDGENVGWLPAAFGVERQALRVITPG